MVSGEIRFFVRDPNPVAIIVCENRKMCIFMEKSQCIKVISLVLSFFSEAEIPFAQCKWNQANPRKGKNLIFNVYLTITIDIFAWVLILYAIIILGNEFATDKENSAKHNILRMCSRYIPETVAVAAIQYAAKSGGAF